MGLELVVLLGFMVLSVCSLFLLPRPLCFPITYLFYMILRPRYTTISISSTRHEFNPTSRGLFLSNHTSLLYSLFGYPAFATQVLAFGSLTPRRPHEIRIRRSLLPRNRSSNRLLSILLRHLLSNPSIRKKRRYNRSRPRRKFRNSQRTPNLSIER
jgi:hypothetical protein